jgi:peptide/nickel transport system substrate-binding protein
LRFSFPAKIAVVFVLALMITPLFTGGASLTPAAYGLGDATATLTEWTIPTGGSLPAGLALDPSGKCCWFVESFGNKVAHLDPSTDTFQEWAIPTPGSNPTSLALTTISGSVTLVGTESTKNKVFLFFPNTGVFKEYTLPEEQSGPQYISIESTGTQVSAWFTERKGDLVGELTYDSISGTARLHQLILPPDAGSGATGVHADSGTIWFAGSTAIVKWDRDSSRFTTWAIPIHPSTQAALIDVDALGQVWYTSTGLGTTITYSYVGVLRSDNTFTEWQVPTVGADARAISINPVTQSPWIAEHGEDKIAELDPSTGGIVTRASPRTTRPEAPTGAIFTSVAGPVLPSTVTIAPATSTPAMSTTGQFTEWTLPAGSGLDDVVVDASGDVWILESSTDKVARLSLSSDFLVSCDPSSLILVQGANATSTCTVTSVDGFASAVQLAGSWVGPIPSGTVYTLPSPVSPPPGRGVSSTLIISASPTASIGTFTFQVNGTSGSLTHKVNLEVTIAAGAADFTLTASPSYLAIAPGGTATSTITVQSLGVFFSPVTLTVSGAPQGMTLVFGTNPVTPPIGRTTSSVLTVHVSGALQGTHTVAIVGRDGSLTRSTTLTAQVTGGPCLIATATYGSELSDEVQFLRSFRDKSILKTNAGSNFMIAFNAWYYSFSPTVAQFIRENSAARTATKFALYPLMAILRLGAASFYLFPTDLEAGAVLAGLLVSSLIGVVYVTIPLTVLLACSRRSYRTARRLQVPVVLILFGVLAAVAFMTVLGAPAIPMMIGTSAIVLASLSTSALSASRALLHMVRTWR